ncbi:MAG: hypothetical protein WBM86_03755 [Waterburya sp.]
MGININDLNTSEVSLLLDNESFLDNVRYLSTEELKMTGGGGHGYYGGGSYSGGGKGYYGSGSYSGGGSGSYSGGGRGRGKGYGRGRGKGYGGGRY